MEFLNVKPVMLQINLEIWLQQLAPVKKNILMNFLLHKTLYANLVTTVVTIARLRALLLAQYATQVLFIIERLLLMQGDVCAITVGLKME